MARELVRHLASHLVEHPEKLEIREEEVGGHRQIHLSVHPEDRRSLIGDGGSTARALRTIVRAAGEMQERRFLLKIEE